MAIEKEEQQRAEFRAILLSLATSQEILKTQEAREEIYKKLEDLYDAPEKQDAFRHFYSDIFSVLVQIKQDETQNIEVLGQNISEIRKNYEPKRHTPNGRKIDIQDSVRKLYDHISLDIARISYSDRGDWELSQTENIEDIKDQTKDMREKIEEAQKQTAQLDKDLKNAQREYITILGIFAAIVLAFTGSLTFSTSILENIGKVNAYRIILLSLVIGLVLFNTIALLLSYIKKISSGEKETKPLIIILPNAVILALIIAVVFAWWTGAIEGRDAKIKSNAEPTAAAVMLWDGGERDKGCFAMNTT